MGTTKLFRHMVVVLGFLPLFSSAEERKDFSSISSGEIVSLPDFPHFLKKGLVMEFHANVEEFDTIQIGKGYMQYRGDWLEVNRTHVIHQHFENSVTDRHSESHGLVISGDISITMQADNSGVLHVSLQSGGKSFNTSIATWQYEANYAPFVRSGGSRFSNASLMADNSDFSQPIWVCGDSYVGVNEWRWPGCIKEMGYFDFLLDGLAGLRSNQALAELKRMVKHGKPKYLLWCLGMNDTFSLYKECLDEVISICESMEAKLVCTTIPTTPTRDREEHTAYIKSLGLRYVDFYHAVGTDSNGNWHEGYLSSDNVHPTAEGARAMANQVLADFPEIMGNSEIVTTISTHQGNVHDMCYDIWGRQTSKRTKGIRIERLSDGSVKKVMF